MPLNNLPPQRLLCSLLDYNPATGALVFKERTPESWPERTIIGKPRKYSAERLCRQFNATYAGRPALASKGNGYGVGTLLGKKVSSHRVIWKMVTGREPAYIDHINGDRSDNRWSNLRSVDRSQNAKNLACYKNNKSGRMGVNWHKPSGKWAAYISSGGKHVHLGLFDDWEEAVSARSKAETAFGYHENHARTALATLKGARNDPRQPHTHKQASPGVSDLPFAVQHTAGTEMALRGQARSHPAYFGA